LEIYIILKCRGSYPLEEELDHEHIWESSLGLEWVNHMVRRRRILRWTSLSEADSGEGCRCVISGRELEEEYALVPEE
jgi:hypothetical protein